MTELLPCVEIDPPAGTEVKATVIWLHGLGADGNDFPPIVPELGLPADAGLRFVFPHAPMMPVTLNQGFVMRAWYDIAEIDLQREHDEEGVKRSAEQVRALIEHERNKHDLPADKILLAGFSQGGAIAMYLGLRYPERLAGLIALSTYAVCAENLAEERSEANAGLSIFQGHGSFDPMVPMDRGEAARDRLLELGYEIEWHSYPMPHAVHPQEIADLGAWMRQRLG